MSDQVLMWLFGIVVTILLTILGLIIKHMSDCRDFRAEVSTIKSDVTRLKEDIGTHETGMRGSIHELKNRVTPVVLWFEREKR